MKNPLEGYRFSPGEASIFVEIYLPKKSRFQAELYSALDEGFQIRTVRKHLRKFEKEVRELMQNYYLDEYHPDIVKTMPPILGGYSIYEVDGYFYNAKRRRVDEERTQVVRIMFLPPELGAIPEDEKDRLKRRVIRDYFRFTGDHAEFEAAFIPRMRVENPAVGESLDADGSRNEAYSKLVQSLRDWECQVALFIFGYVIFRMCERMKELKTTTGITEEDQIWVTSLWNLVVNRVVAVRSGG